MKQPPTKDDIVRLVESCGSPGGKLAVGLAAFSGLKPGVLRELMLRNLVELSLPGLQFLQAPSRIEVEGRRRFSRVKFYTFLSSSGCRYLLGELKARSQPLSPDSLVVDHQAFREADEAVHGAGVRWLDLGRYFISCFMVTELDTGLRREEIYFMSGHVIKEEDLAHLRDFFHPKSVEIMRKGYVQVERRFFV